jgi:hypothetical protein
VVKAERLGRLCREQFAGNGGRQRAASVAASYDENAVARGRREGEGAHQAAHERPAGYGSAEKRRNRR